VDLRAEAASHPTRILLGLEQALLVPAGGGAVLNADFATGSLAGTAGLALLSDLARLLASRGVTPAPDTPGRFPELVGRCEAIQRLFEAIERYAPSTLAVHVFGETGTGKERVAEAVHRRSARAGRPFVAVNASALPDELFEAEMFGHTRGAFTGAVAERRGYVAEAVGGTLFLDEVSDLSPRAQAKLLRFLATGEYRRLGETEPRRADVRILTAANQRLRDRVAAGSFREDLFYRLCDVTIELPPLRERGDDVLLLARHFLRRAAEREGLPVGSLPAAVAERLRRHTWPGNVRELEREMHRLVVSAGRGPLRPEHLSFGSSKSVAPGGALREARRAFERDLLARTLAQHSGNKARAAWTLGISRQALVAKCRALGL
jgi:DNA-binding NtrC family response regulator